MCPSLHNFGSQFLIINLSLCIYVSVCYLSIYPVGSVSLENPDLSSPSPPWSIRLKLAVRPPALPAAPRLHVALLLLVTPLNSCIQAPHRSSSLFTRVKRELRTVLITCVFPGVLFFLLTTP